MTTAGRPSWRPQQSNMHYSPRSYLIILLTEVRYMFYYITYFAIVSLWLFLLAKCKILYVLCVGNGKYLASTVNLVVTKQMYTTLELCHHQYQIMFILQFNNFYTAKISIYSAIFTIFLCKFDHFSRRYRRKQKRVCL